MSDCARELQKRFAAPRTCARCGLGPCHQEGSPPKEPCPRGPLAKSIDFPERDCKVCGSPAGGVCLIREEYPHTTAPQPVESITLGMNIFGDVLNPPPAPKLPTDLIKTPEQIANAIDANDAYPWSKGDTQILLRSFIFEHLSTPQSTLDFKKEIPALQAYVEWIMTGVAGPASGSKLNVVK